MVAVIRGSHGVQEVLRGQRRVCLLHSVPPPPALPTGSLRLCARLCSVAVMFSFLGTSTPPAIAATPVSAIPAALGVNGYSPVPTQPTGQPAPDALYPNGVHPYPGGALCLPTLLHQPSGHYSHCWQPWYTSPLQPQGLRCFFLLSSWAEMLLGFLSFLFLPPSFLFCFESVF